MSTLAFRPLSGRESGAPLSVKELLARYAAAEARAGWSSPTCATCGATTGVLVGLDSTGAGRAFCRWCGSRTVVRLAPLEPERFTNSRESGKERE
jgi:hypothetical protein